MKSSQRPIICGTDFSIHAAEAANVVGPCDITVAHVRPLLVVRPPED